MFKFKFMLAILIAMTISSSVMAAGVGYLNYKKVQDSYPYAKSAAKEIDAKGLELQQYLVDKEKEFKALDTPVKKQNFEAKVAQEFKVKEDAYLKLKVKKEEEVYNKIQEAAKKVLVEQKLDTILDFRVIFVGGLDVTDLVIQKLGGK